MRFGQQIFWLGLAAGGWTAYQTFQSRAPQQSTESAVPIKTGSLDTMTDPELLLQLAQEEMRAAQAKNRERAAQAITQKNNLQALIDQTQRTIDSLQAKADAAREKGDDALAEKILAEKTSFEQAQADSRAAFGTVTETVEQIKIAMRREYERGQAKTALAMRLQIEWRVTQIVDSVLQTAPEMPSDDLLRRAQIGVETAQADRRRRLEIFAAHLRQMTQTLHTEAERAAQAGETEAADALRSDLATLQAATV